MARDAVALTAVASGAATTTPAGVAISPTNGAEITLQDGARVLVKITNTAGAEKTVTFKKGESPPALRAGVGDLVVSVPATTGDVVIVLETARFNTAKGAILVDFQSAMAGKITAFQLPKVA